MAASFPRALDVVLVQLIILHTAKSEHGQAELAPVSLGIETAGGLMVPLIKRNSLIPTRQSMTFSTYADKQENAVFDIYEGERILANDDHLIGKLVLTNLRPSPRGVPEITVTFDVDADGILNVTAVEKSTGKQSTIRIGYDKNRLTEKEIQLMIEEGKKHKIKDEEKRIKIQAKHELESYAHDMKNKVEYDRYSQGINQNKKNLVLTKYKETLNWLKKNPLAEKDQIVSKHEDLKKFWSYLMNSVREQ